MHFNEYVSSTQPFPIVELGYGVSTHGSNGYAQ